MKGRDYFGEVMEECRRHGLYRVAYYSLIFDDWAYQNHPNWRILPEEGEDRHSLHPDGHRLSQFSLSRSCSRMPARVGGQL